MYVKLWSTYSLTIFYLLLVLVSFVYRKKGLCSNLKLSKFWRFQFFQYYSICFLIHVNINVKYVRTTGCIKEASKFILSNITMFLHIYIAHICTYVKCTYIHMFSVCQLVPNVCSLHYVVYAINVFTLFPHFEDLFLS